MDQLSKQFQRAVHVVSLANLAIFSEEEKKLPDELPTLMSDLRDILLKKASENDDTIDSNIFQYVEAIKTKVQALDDLPEKTEIFDQLQAILKTYIADILPITRCLNILSDGNFHGIFYSLIYAEATIDLKELFQHNPKYARLVFDRSFEMLALPVMTDFLNDKYPHELFTHVAYIFRTITCRIQSTVEPVTFKRTDLKDQVPSLRLLVEFVERNKQNLDEGDMDTTIDAALNLFWELSDDTILVPNLLQSGCASYFVKWILMKDVSMDIQRPCIHILHNLARHEAGVQALNTANCISVLREFKQRILDPNKTSNEELYVELRLLYCMVISLLAEPKENREDLDNLRSVLDRLMQLTVDAGQSENNKYGGFHVSEPLVVLTKLSVHDEILHYIIKEAGVKNMEAKSKIGFFCDLIIKFRGALAGDDDLDQVTLIALFNLVWSISFHDQYIEELKADSKFLITVKTLANDSEEGWMDQYVPAHMSSISKAANGILWNLDEDNPARIARMAPPVSSAASAEQERKKTNNQISVMVSYSHSDGEFCHKLVEGLQKDTRVDVWVDFAHCHSGDLWEEIGNAIEKSQVVLFLLSKDYQESKSCRQEVMYAKDTLQKRFVPIYMGKDFVATSWLGVRIAGPQYIRFGKRSFEETIQELVKIIIDEKPAPPKETKPPATTENIPLGQPKPNKDNKPTPPKSIEENHLLESALKPSSKKPVEKWTRKDISQWFDENHIHQELIDLYDFQHGTDLLLYGQCLRPDWQMEYNDMKQRYEQKHNAQLYRDQFVRFVGAVHRLQPTKTTYSKTCVIS